MEGTATQFRRLARRLLARRLATGDSINARRERRVEVVLAAHTEPDSSIDRLVRRSDVIVGDPDDLMHVDWSSEWRP
ncbi:MAG: hypothetical protein H0V33_10490 [Acidimicrobiia bacterium]|nr:hypothetical protein [Acidimicrobiia bacterium]